jgi:riboflavin synthase
MGTVTSIDPLDPTKSGGGGWSMTIGSSAPILGDCHIGDSIACNGACLTVTWFGADSFKVGLAPETLERTDLGTFSFFLVLMNNQRPHDGNRRSEGWR